MKRMHHIRANLAAEPYFLGFACYFGDFFPLAAAFQVQQTGCQHVHRLLFVLVLAALVLTGSDDARRQMRDAHGRVGHIHMLSACAGRAVGVYPQVGFVYLHFVLDVFKERHHIHAAERRVAFAFFVERRDAHEAVDAVLALEMPVGVAASHEELGRGDASLLAFAHRHDFGLKALSFGPADVHSQQHLGPVLSVGAAFARLDLTDRVTLVVFS